MRGANTLQLAHVDTFLTLILPYLDPPVFVQRWVAHAPTRLTATLRRGCVYIGYVVWLSVVVSVAALTPLLVMIIAGFAPPVEDVPPDVMRVIAAIMLGIEAILALLVWLPVRLWLARENREAVLRARPRRASMATIKGQHAVGGTCARDHVNTGRHCRCGARQCRQTAVRAGDCCGG